MLGEDTRLFLLAECLNVSICKYFCLPVICASLAFQGNKTSVKVKEKTNLGKAQREFNFYYTRPKDSQRGSEIYCLWMRLLLGFVLSRRPHAPCPEEQSICNSTEIYNSFRLIISQNHISGEGSNSENSNSGKYAKLSAL